MSTRRRQEAEDCHPLKQPRWSEVNVSTSNNVSNDAMERSQRQVGARNIVILSMPDLDMMTGGRETQEDSLQVENEIPKICDGDQSTAIVSVEEIVKHPLGGIEDDSDITTNPMYNPVILTHMFSLCPLKYLEKFRLVCKLWYNLTLPRWRNEAPLFFTDMSMFDRQRFQTNRNVSPVPAFVHFVQNPVFCYYEHPFRQVRLIQRRIRPLCSTMDQFYSICAQSITHLQLSGCQFDSLGVFREICFRKFPNLKELTLGDINFHDDRNTNPKEPSSYSQPDQCQANLKYLQISLYNNYPRISWLELLSHYPNLTTLKVYNAKDTTLKNLLAAIRIIRRHDFRLLNITDLDIRPSFFAKDRLQLWAPVFPNDMFLNLEKLSIDFGNEIKEWEIKNILTRLAPTLRKLTTNRPEPSMPYKNFPFGVILKQLEEFTMNDRLCESIAFLKYTPNLKKLRISEWYGCSDCSFPPMMTKIIKTTDTKQLTNVKLTSVVELTFDYVMGPAETQYLIDTLPNVRKLRMPMDEEQFKLVCMGWKDTLIDLEVVGNRLGDSAITGLSAKDVSNFNNAEARNSKVHGEQKEKFLGVNLEEALVERPNMTGLINLKAIKMVNGGISPTRVMDCAAFYGFLKLPRLQSLELRSSMKERAQNALKAKLSAFKIVVGY